MHALHPVLRLFIEQPQLAAEHASAYAALFAQDSAAAAAQWQRRVVLKLACGAGLTAAITLAGVASMLWTALPGLTLAQHWPLWAPPLVPALGASWAAWAAREGTSVPPFAA